MRRLDEIEAYITLGEVAAFANEIAGEVDGLAAKLAAVMEKMDRMEGVGRDRDIENEGGKAIARHMDGLVTHPVALGPQPGSVVTYTAPCADLEELVSWQGHEMTRLGAEVMGLETRLRILREDVMAHLADEDPEDYDEFNEDSAAGRCPECGAPYQIVRPGKTQETCRCDEVATLRAEVAKVQREHEALLDHNERKCAENDDLRQRLDEKTRAEMNSPSQAVADNDDSRQWLDRMAAAHAKTNAENADLHIRLRQSLQREAALKAEHDRLLAKWRERGDAIDALKAENAELRCRLAEEAVARRQRLAREEAKPEYERLRAERAGLLADLNRAVESGNHLVGEVDRMRVEIERLRAENEERAAPLDEKMVMRYLVREMPAFWADAELGALVRRIPMGSALCRSDSEWGAAWECNGPTLSSRLFGNTPEAALRAALGEEQPCDD